MSSAYRTMKPSALPLVVFADEWVRNIVAAHQPREAEVFPRVTLVQLDALLQRHRPPCRHCHRPVEHITITRSELERTMTMVARCHGRTGRRTLDERALVVAFEEDRGGLASVLLEPWFERGDRVL